MTQKLVLLNGPKRSGKDTCASALVAHFKNSIRLGFADHLKNATHAAYGLNVPFDFYEENKDTPLPDFFGLSPREAYIAHSESYMKPLHGNNIFSEFFSRLADKSPAEIIFIPDSGFIEEAEFQRNRVGSENILLIRIHREGHDFTGDSRNYITLPGVLNYDIFNRQGIDELQYSCVSIVKDWLKILLAKPKIR